MALAADLDDVRRMAAARAFGMKGVDHTLFHRRDRMLDKAAFIQRVGMDHHLHIHGVGDRQAIVDGGRGGAPVFMQLQRAGPAAHLFLQCRRKRGIALAGEGQIHRECVRGLQHPPDMPGTRRAGCGQRAMRRTGAAAKHRRQAGMQRILDLLRADVMDMAVEAACCQHMAFARDGLGSGADDDIHIRLRVRVAGLADPGDHAVLQPDIGLVDARHIDNQRVGDDRIDGAAGPAGLRLAHAVADDLAAAELHLLAIAGEILLHLDDQVGVCQPQPVARGRAIHVGIGGAGNLFRHQSSPMICWLKP